jgi:LysM repeat protein
MLLSTRCAGLRCASVFALMALSSVIGGCSSGTGVALPDGPSWSLAEKTPPTAVAARGERNALGVKVDPDQTSGAPASIVEVVRGDTLHGIALQHRVSVKALMAANNLASPTIRPGQKLTVPNSMRN